MGQVGESAALVIPGRPMKFQKEKVLRAFVKAEGPTCVLSIVDLEVNPVAMKNMLSTSSRLRFRKSGSVFCRCTFRQMFHLHINLLTKGGNLGVAP